MAQRFRSRVDLWRVLLSGALLAYFAVVLARRVAAGEAHAGFLLLLLVPVWLFAWQWLTTAYVVGESTLLVRSGPWREVVPLNAIRKLRRTRIPVAAPALSTERIQVLYETSRSVIVSPADRDAFIRAIRARVPGVALEGFAETG